MRRTQSRVLVTGKLAPSHAFTFGVAVGLYGMCVLWSGCNPMTASLGALNVLLYACVYTPLKRLSIGCTWAGAVVGAIPPLMGYSAGTGGTIDAAALVLAAVIYSWQFPHFNGLSWNLRGDYSRAGYRVMCVTAPMLCRATSLR
jgi:protoheme IX farnesyltransferase